MDRGVRSDSERKRLDSLKKKCSGNLEAGLLKFSESDATFLISLLDRGESRWVVSSMEAVAKFFGVTSTLVRRDWQNQGMPGSKDFGYPLDEIAQWRDKRLKESVGPVEEARKRKQIAEALKAELDNRLTELRLAKEQGLMIDKESAMAEVREMFHRVRSRLEQLPQELGSTVAPEYRADFQADLKYKLQLVLKEMEGWAE